MREKGFDVGADGTLKTSAGVFTPAIAATYMTKFNGASTPGGPDVSRLSRANADGIFAPRLKATTSLGWRPNDVVNLWLDGRYISHYTDYTPPRTLGNVWYFDASVEIAIGRMLAEPGMIKGLSLLVSSTNLADKLPPYSTHFRATTSTTTTSWPNDLRAPASADMSIGRVPLAALCAMLLAWCARARALDAALDVDQYAHTAWKAREGFIRGTVHAMAQTPDGYLWLGTDFGLTRFDGVRNVPAAR
jgi:hypothetical protein